MYPKTYVIDTSVYLTDHTSINNFGRSDIIVPLKVLEEIDKHKKRQDSVGNNARSIIRSFDSLRENGNLQDGVSLGDKRGSLYVKGYDSNYIPDDLDRKNADHIIIATALTLRETEPERDVILVTRDIQLRVICDSLGPVSYTHLTLPTIYSV